LRSQSFSPTGGVVAQGASARERDRFVSEDTVSTIIPAYQTARTIRRAVDSVLAQTRAVNEILIVDDGSSDNLAGALAPYGDRVTLIRQANGGAARARNRGIEEARGSWIAFLDADDYWEPHKLEQQLAVRTRQPEVGLIAGRWYCQPPGEPRIPPQADSYWEGHIDRVLHLTGARAFDVAMRVWTSTVLVRREVLGTQRFEPGLATAEDRDLWFRLVRTCPVYLLGEPLATGVLEPGSLSRSDVAGDCRNMLSVIQRHAPELGRRERRRWEAIVYREWAGVCLGEGNPAAARGPAWRRLGRQPFSLEAWWIVLKATLLALAPARAEKPADVQEECLT
jgi:glycosyltransferase involved in cell wall biosynthesis